MKLIQKFIVLTELGYAVRPVSQAKHPELLAVEPSQSVAYLFTKADVDALVTQFPKQSFRIYDLKQLPNNITQVISI